MSDNTARESSLKTQCGNCWLKPMRPREGTITASSRIVVCSLLSRIREYGRKILWPVTKMTAAFQKKKTDKNWPMLMFWFFLAESCLIDVSVPGNADDCSLSPSLQGQTIQPGEKNGFFKYRTFLGMNLSPFLFVIRISCFNRIWFYWNSSCCQCTGSVSLERPFFIERGELYGNWAFMVTS